MSGQKEILNFIKVGIINTLFYYLLYSCFIFIGLDYRLSVLFATIIGVFFSFKTFGTYVFRNTNNILIFKFILVYIVLYLVNIFFIDVFDSYINNYYISGLVATFLCAVLSFLLNKFIVFKS